MVGKVAMDKAALRKRMREKGHSNIKSFHEDTKVPLSYMTCLKALEGEGQVGAPAYMLILNKLGYTRLEIKRLLEQAGDNNYHHILK
ncbi:MAG: hypothetical protein ACYTEQ_01780 [Planctomycetota bacterium]|jgi:hypothetical protein